MNLFTTAFNLLMLRNVNIILFSCSITDATCGWLRTATSDASASGASAADPVWRNTFVWIYRFYLSAHWHFVFHFTGTQFSESLHVCVHPDLLVILGEHRKCLKAKLFWSIQSGPTKKRVFFLSNSSLWRTRSVGARIFIAILSIVLPNTSLRDSPLTSS